MSGGSGTSVRFEVLSLQIDHVVYATTDVEAASARIAERFGVSPVWGGVHPGMGTHNHLLSLGDTTYLEIIGPDPEQPSPPHSRPFGIDALNSDADSRLAGFACKAPDLEEIVAKARAVGYDLGEVRAMSRETPDGTTLAWRLTINFEAAGDGLVPFLIDWGDTKNPAVTTPVGGKLLSLRAEHPDPGAISGMYGAVGIEMDVAAGAAPQLIATIETAQGEVELR